MGGFDKEKIEVLRDLTRSGLGKLNRPLVEKSKDGLTIEANNDSKIFSTLQDFHWRSPARKHSSRLTLFLNIQYPGDGEVLSFTSVGGFVKAGYSFAKKCLA